ncbi:complex I subunit 1 family protein [Thermogladius sp. KZ2Tp1]|uniref:complex I subunit 1 family protein n=1 Tax=Thermogladius sp. KZ2Tp1 TaxID=3136289 RepID=UPI003DA7D0CC
MDYAMLVFTALVFPGLLFLFVFSLLVEYALRKVVARMQRRMGPSYTGPAGVLQPFADFFKLIRDKEVVANRYSMPRLAESLLALGISSLVVAALFLPLNPYTVSAPFDFFIYMYLCCVVSPLLLLFASLSMPGPYTVVGVSRILSFITVCEPAYFTSLLIPVVLSSGVEPAYSIYATSRSVYVYWANPFTAPLMALSLVSSLVILQARAMLNPFNIPEAEQEIIAGFETEFSGPLLGLARLLHDIEYSVTMLSIVYLVLGGPYPYPHLSVQGLALLAGKLALVFLASGLLRASTGRLRVEQALDVMAKYSLAPSLVGVVLASIYALH